MISLLAASFFLFGLNEFGITSNVRPYFLGEPIPDSIYTNHPDPATIKNSTCHYIELNKEELSNNSITIFNNNNFDEDIIVYSMTVDVENYVFRLESKSFYTFYTKELSNRNICFIASNSEFEIQTSSTNYNPIYKKSTRGTAFKNNENSLLFGFCKSSMYLSVIIENSVGGSVEAIIHRRRTGNWNGNCGSSINYYDAVIDVYYLGTLFHEGRSALYSCTNQLCKMTSYATQRVTSDPSTRWDYNWKGFPLFDDLWLGGKGIVECAKFGSPVCPTPPPIFYVSSPY